MTVDEVLDDIDQWIANQRKFISETSVKNLYNIGVGYESALSGMSTKIQDIRKRAQKELEEIIDGD